MLNFLNEKETIVQHMGVFRKQINLFEAISIIVTGTIGAGILGIPYAISKVGTTIGILYLVFFGFLIMGFNLLIGEIAVRTKGEFHWVGLSKKYLGPVGEWAMMFLIYLVFFGILNAYLVGVGQSLKTLFGGSEVIWTLCFWFVGTILIYFGMRIIKIMDFVLAFLILGVVIFIVFISSSHVSFINLRYSDPTLFLFPFGVILFAFSGSGSVLEAHTLLKGDKTKFKKAIIISGLIIMAAYILFATVVTGVTGRETTEIATIGLGNKIGPIALVLGNLFAALALAGSFTNIGLQFRHSLVWDFKLSKVMATMVVSLVPLSLFLMGIRRFILILDIVGGVFFTVEMSMILLIYWRAKQKGDFNPGKYKLHHTILVASTMLIVLLVGGVYSMMKLF